MDMSYYFSICSTYMYQHRYIDFLMENYSELKLPYDFPVTLGYLASPLLMEGGAFLCFDEQDELVGALGYIRGTGEKDYNDQHVIQIQVAYIVEKHRGTRLFKEGMAFLVQHMEEDSALKGLQPVEELRFWTSDLAHQGKLFTKFAEHIASTGRGQGLTHAYSASMKYLKAYLASFMHSKRPQAALKEV